MRDLCDAVGLHYLTGMEDTAKGNPTSQLASQSWVDAAEEAPEPQSFKFKGVFGPVELDEITRSLNLAAFDALREHRRLSGA